MVPKELRKGRVKAKAANNLVQSIRKIPTTANLTNLWCQKYFIKPLQRSFVCSSNIRTVFHESNLETTKGRQQERNQRNITKLFPGT